VVVGSSLLTYLLKDCRGSIDIVEFTASRQADYDGSRVTGVTTHIQLLGRGANQISGEFSATKMLFLKGRQ
jgi:hypothetical protein